MMGWLMSRRFVRSVEMGIPSSVGKRSQGYRREGRRGRAGGVHHDGEEGVIAVEAEQIDDALLAECRHRAAVRLFADAPVAQDLHREVVRHLLIRSEAIGTASIGDGIGDLARNARLQREWIVDLPLDLLRPFAADDEDDELSD